MTEYILILMMVASGSATQASSTSQAILFPSQAACENAKTQVLTEFTTNSWTYKGLARAICVPRGNP